MEAANDTPRLSVQTDSSGRPVVAVPRYTRAQYNAQARQPPGQPRTKRRRKKATRRTKGLPPGGRLPPMEDAIR
ncbi:hypothetical protein LSAT2_015543 [Lamellibrachia satsuma]|nr:hypothetical protein LSAT2_015543 [Lamellibrachia satsuma]